MPTLEVTNLSKFVGQFHKRKVLTLVRAEAVLSYFTYLKQKIIA